MFLIDSLRNFVSGLGGSKDKATYSHFETMQISDNELNSMHRGDWLARKIVDIIPNDMTREWRDWQASTAQIELIEAVEKSPLVNLQSKVNEAMRIARLLRGSVIYMGMKDNTPELLLDLDKIRKDDLLYLNVLNRRYVTTGPIIRDATSEFYGEPEYYELRSKDGVTVRVHPSRMVRFIGADILDEDIDVEGWGDSVLQIVYTAVKNAASSQENVASLIHEAKTDVVYIPDLNKHLQDSKTTAQLTTRFGYANQMKSLFNMLLLQGKGGSDGEGERWEQKQISFSQMPELMRQYLQVAAGAADIPVTRLLGESPSGLNSTGDSDIRNYYDNLTSKQKNELQPKLHRLDEVVIRSALGSRPANIFYIWSPLWGLSEKEKADIFKTKADAARTLAGNGTTPALLNFDALSEALTNELIEDGSLSGLDEAVAKFGTVEENEPTEEDIAAAGNVVPLRKAANDAAPRTLYMRRDVVNAAEILSWAKEQGFATTLPVDDLHVTIAYSKIPIDWMKVGETWNMGSSKGEITIAPGGPRMMEMFGEAVVLLFSSTELAWRHMAIREAGASWSHAEYQPHITITYKSGDVDIDAVVPYRGPIVLGPEIFEEVQDDWQENIKEE